MAQAFYADGLAANGGDGSLAGPWNNLDQITAWSAGTGFQPGDVLYLKRGTTLACKVGNGLSLYNSGLKNDPIIIRDYGTGVLPAIDCGGSPIAGAWVEQSANGLPGVYFNAYSGATVNGFTEDSVWLMHALTIGGLAAGQWYWNHTSNPSSPYQPAYAIGLYYKPSSGTAASHTLRKCNGNNGVGLMANVRFVRFVNVMFKGGAIGLANATPTSVSPQGIECVKCTFTELRTATNLFGFNTFPIIECAFLDCTVIECGKGIHIGSRDTGVPCIGHVMKGNQTSNIDVNQRFSSFGTTLDREGMGLQNPVGCRVIGNVVSSGCFNGGIILWVHGTQGKFEGNLIAANEVRDILGSGIVAGAAVLAPCLGYNVVSGNRIARCGGYGIKINTSSQFRPSYCQNNVIDACTLDHLYTQSSCSGWEVQNNISLNPVSVHAGWGGASACRPNANNYFPSAGLCFRENGVLRDWASFKAEVLNNGVTIPPPDDSSVSVDPAFTPGGYRLPPASSLRTAGLNGTYPVLDGDEQLIAGAISPIGAYL